MKITFVRHGEALGNVTNSYQDSSTPLTEKGRKEAEIVSERLAKMPFDYFLCSTYVRAKETADIINKEVNLPIDYSDLLVEMREPSVFDGKLKEDESLLEIKRIIDENYDNPDYHYSDEENFFEQKVRAEKIIKYIENLSVDKGIENLLCVTHGFFMRMILGVVIFGDDFTPLAYKRMLKRIFTNNTSLTVFEFDKERIKKNKYAWKFITWNDYSHLDGKVEL